MEPFFSGRCACGSLHYAIPGQPVEQTHCQCRDCQRRSGAGHSSWLIFAAAPEAVLSGPSGQWTTTGDGGIQKRHIFCPTCGTPVCLCFPAMPGLIAVTVGSLDDPGRFAPRQVTWTEPAQTWDSLPPGLIAHTRMPPA